jgi:XTP/dITP diphosphohydrolase
MIMELVIASNNQHKVDEIQAMLGETVKCITLKEIGFLEEIEETGATFEENALIKANAVAKVYDGFVLADDSGLEVDVLGGAPGIYSARYAGEGASSRQLCHKLLSELSNVPDSKRNARFRTVMALVDHNKNISQTFEGKVDGFIGHMEVGNFGFGYDPVFYYPPFSKTLAQVSADKKNSVSHRANALVGLKKYLSTYI